MKRNEKKETKNSRSISLDNHEKKEKRILVETANTERGIRKKENAQEKRIRRKHKYWHFFSSCKKTFTHKHLRKAHEKEMERNVEKRAKERTGDEKRGNKSAVGKLNPVG